MKDDMIKNIDSLKKCLAVITEIEEEYCRLAEKYNEKGKLEAKEWTQFQVYNHLINIYNK